MQNKSSFSSSLGFVLATAGSAVGLGNIWRFPYLAAKNGGGLFLIVYLILVATFGFALLITEIGIGRKTKSSPINAYKLVHPKWSRLGNLALIVPFFLLSFYGVIGGWVLKYSVVYLTGNGSSAATNGYFSDYISQPIQPIVYMVIFTLLTSFVVYRGVNNGIEKLSKIMMPILLILIIGISIYSLTLSSTDEFGNTRTGIDGLLAYVIPDTSDLTFKKFINVLIDAMGQLFFSISVGAGVMVTFGAYMNDKNNMVDNVAKTEACDTFVAIMAGIMVIVPVFVTQGRDGMNASGPSLLFESLPKVFSTLGTGGQILGGVFFVIVFFAAITSSVSIMESIVASVMEAYNLSRTKTVIFETVILVVIGVAVCLGYNLFYFDITLPNGNHGQLLDVIDYITNNLLMPTLSLATCILIGWVVKPKYVIDEATKNGEKFKDRRLYSIVVKYIAPIFIIILLLQSFGLI